VNFLPEKELQAAVSSTVTKVEGENIFFNGHNVSELMLNATFSQTMYLAATGKMPDVKISKMIDCILNSLATETVQMPSTVCARIAAENGAKLNTAIAGGVCAMDYHHGLHIEESMAILKHSIKDMHDISLNVDDQAEITVQHYHNKSFYLHGYGNKFHSVDSRVTKLLDKATELGYHGEYVKLAEAIAPAYKNVFQLDMPLNLEGLVAAILLEIGIEPEAGPSFFILARIPCLVANIIEVKGWKK